VRTDSANDNAKPWTNSHTMDAWFARVFQIYCAADLAFKIAKYETALANPDIDARKAQYCENKLEDINSAIISAGI